MDNNHISQNATNNSLSHSVTEIGDRLTLMNVSDRSEQPLNVSSRSLPSNYVEMSLHNLSSRSNSSPNSVVVPHPFSKLNPSAQEFVPRSNRTNVAAQPILSHHSYRTMSHIPSNTPISKNHNFSNGNNKNNHNSSNSHNNNNNNNNVHPSSNMHDNENNIEDYVSLSYLKDFINHISNKPSMYDQGINELTLIINSYLDEDDCVLELIVNQIVDQSIIDGNFLYNGVRLCYHFMENLRKTSSGQSFKQLLFNRNQRECSRKATDITSANIFIHLRGLALFTAELYSRCKAPELVKHLPSLLMNILSSDIKRDESVKCVCDVLKLCGQQMEMHFSSKGKPDFLNMLEKLKETVKCDVSTHIEEMVNKILILIANDWIQPQSSIPSNLVNPYLNNAAMNEFEANNQYDSSCGLYDFGNCGDENNAEDLTVMKDHLGLTDIGKTLRRTDCILEVHDARIPFSGRNIGLIKKLIANKPVILILNKSDLLDSTYKPIIKSTLMKEMNKNNICLTDVFFMDSISSNIKRSGYNNEFLSAIIKSINSSDLIDQTDYSNFEKGYNLLVMGIPNVGKSTIINRMRNIFLNKAGKATITGPKAGVTKAVLEKIKICEYPKRLYLFDTPGILEPSFNQLRDKRDIEIFMRCALCATLNDDIIGKELIADYLLYWFNKHSKFEYVDFLGLPSPTNDIIEALTYASIKYNCFQDFYNLDTGNRERRPNLNDVADKFITAFRAGKFGNIFLDIDLLT